MEQPDMVTDGPLFERVHAAIQQLRPALQEDGGDLKLVGIEDEDIAIIEFFGACVGCPMSEMTLRSGIESQLRGSVPEIMAVDVVSDRALPQRSFKDVLDQVRFI